ncbi:MAG: nucleotide exchange factor GrpE [Ignavibacteria bacterium]|nr:nucleotide exchange factor GrpE [Ignavibacteria bacterium]
MNKPMNEQMNDEMRKEMNEQDIEPSDELESVKVDTIDSLRADVEQWRDLAQRKAAEAENVRRRSLQEKQTYMRYASEHLITRLIPVLDDLHAALEASKTATETDSLRTGIAMIYAKAKKIFEDAGVSIIEGGEGEPFNVDIHEALMHMPSEMPEGFVVQVVQRGYSLHDKIIRHAKVITSAGLLSAGDSSDSKE